jgi:predicted FMN-binding regulatory protein PaiB
MLDEDQMMKHEQKILVGTIALGLGMVALTTHVARNQPDAQLVSLPTQGDLVIGQRGEAYVVEKCYGSDTCLVHHDGKLLVRKVQP